MVLLNNMRAIAFVTVVLLFALTACGGGSDVASPLASTAVPDASAPLATPVPPTAVPTAVPAAIPTAIPAAIPAAIPTAIPAAIPTAIPAAIPTAVPTAVPTAMPTATPEPPPVLDEFGFVLGLDRGADVTNLPGNTDAQGIVQLEYSGVNVILSWVPVNGATIEGLVTGTFATLRNNQPDLTLDTISESELKVGLETGTIIGFKSVDGSGDVVGGGLIGAWNCVDQDTSFTILVTGQDASVVQLRLNRLVDNFDCA